MRELSPLNVTETVTSHPSAACRSDKWVQANGLRGSQLFPLQQAGLYISGQCKMLTAIRVDVSSVSGDSPSIPPELAISS